MPCFKRVGKIKPIVQVSGVYVNFLENFSLLKFVNRLTSDRGVIKCLDRMVKHHELPLLKKAVVHGGCSRLQARDCEHKGVY